MHRARAGVRHNFASCGELPRGPGALLAIKKGFYGLTFEIITMSLFDDLRSTSADGPGRPGALEAAQMDVLGADGTDGMETHESQDQRARSTHRHKDPMVREPSAAELREFTTLQDIADWAKLKGAVIWAASKPGSLIRLLVNAEDMEDLDISEFASISQKQIEAILPSWKYSKTQQPPREEVQHWLLSADDV